MHQLHQSAQCQHCLVLSSCKRGFLLSHSQYLLMHQLHQCQHGVSIVLSSCKRGYLLSHSKYLLMHQLHQCQHRLVLSSCKRGYLLSHGEDLCMGQLHQSAQRQHHLVPSSCKRISAQSFIARICACVNSTSQHSVSIASFYHPAREDFCLVIVSICSCINSTSVSMASASPYSIILQERISAQSWRVSAHASTSPVSALPRSIILHYYQVPISAES